MSGVLFLSFFIYFCWGYYSDISRSLMKRVFIILLSVVFFSSCSSIGQWPEETTCGTLLFDGNEYREVKRYSGWITPPPSYGGLFIQHDSFYGLNDAETKAYHVWYKADYVNRNNSKLYLEIKAYISEDCFKDKNDFSNSDGSLIMVDGLESVVSIKTENDSYETSLWSIHLEYCDQDSMPWFSNRGWFYDFNMDFEIQVSDAKGYMHIVNGRALPRMFYTF